MLDTIHEFALERLDAGGESDRLRAAHADWFAGVALRIDPEIRERADRTLLDRYVADAGNLGAALQHLIDRGDHGRAAEMGLALWPFWWVHSLFRPGIGWMLAVLAGGSDLSPAERANADLALGMLAFGHGDDDLAADALRTAVDLHGSLGDDRAAATATVPLGLITAATDTDAGEEMLRRATAEFRRLHDGWGLSFALLSLGGAALFRDRFDDAVPLLEEGVDVARSAGTSVFLSHALVNLGLAYAGLGRLDAAEAALRDAITAAAALDSRETTARALDALAAVALAAGDPDRGALLSGTAERVRRSVGATVWTTDRPLHRRTQDTLAAELGGARARERIEAGTRLTPEEALDSPVTA
jgi:tetratricopeptide (TPR) repeat protein